MEKYVNDYSILEPYHYLSRIPGKDVRGLLVDSFQTWLRIPEDKVEVVKSIIGTLHNASLLVDDIEDNSKMRRGVPVAHSIYGTPNTINCANYVYFIALEQCHELNSADAMRVYVREMLNLHRGQGYDILWREQCKCPSEDEYRAMVLNKTGGLFRLAVGLMQSFSNCTTDFTELLNALGLYFQIRDDYVNISSVSYMQTKSFCEDLTEGKFSFPILHAINSCPGDSRLLNILRQRTSDDGIKRYAVQLMIESGSLTYTREVLRGLRQEIVNHIQSLGGHQGLIGLIEKLDSQLDSDEQQMRAQLAADSSELITTL